MDDNKSTKKEYEISFLVKKPEDIDAIESVVKQYDAEISFKSPVSEIKLAYPIKKQSYANFAFLYFSTLPDNVEKITKSLKLNSSILRLLLVTPPVVRGLKREQVTDLKTAPIKQSESVLAPQQKSSILTNEALEEKLEEILK